MLGAHWCAHVLEMKRGIRAMGRFFAPAILLLLGVIFSAVGGGMAFLIGQPILDTAEASLSWPNVPGTVILSEMDEYEDEEDGRMYRAIVVYEYALDGGEFQSDRIWLDGNFSTSDRTLIFETLKKYPVDKQVTVFYNPATPAESALEPGTSTGGYIVYGLGLGFLGVGCLLILIMFVVTYLSFRTPPSRQDPFPGRTEPAESSEYEYEYRDPLADDESF